LIKENGIKLQTIFFQKSLQVFTCGGEKRIGIVLAASYKFKTSSSSKFFCCNICSGVTIPKRQRKNNGGSFKKLFKNASPQMCEKN
jgi:hypothetical protein